MSFLGLILLIVVAIGINSAQRRHKETASALAELQREFAILRKRLAPAMGTRAERMGASDAV